ncbi:MAG: TrkH family potassium uptake protein [Peptococcaceae bacterium]|nr:TrkH family potassium uptake protein [Peptococcaceae bacterium]
MHKSYVWSSVGGLLLLLGTMMLVPAAAGRYYAETEYLAFLISAGVVLLIGLLLFCFFKPKDSKRRRLQMKDGYAVVTYGWLAVVMLSILPYLLTGTVNSLTDAFFESASGFTMTGATILTQIESQARCVLLWRSMTQWLGGMGVLVLFVALLNGQNQGSLQLFRAEGLGSVKQKLHFKTLETAFGLLLIYLLHTILVIVLYWLSGLGLFDAVNHGLTVISTGGFSTRTAGIGAFHSAAVEWVTIAAMFLTGINYTLFIHAWHNKSLREFKESLELRVYFWLLVIASVVVVWFTAPLYDGNLALAVRHGVFQVVSIVTTAGFVLCDIEQWAVPAQLIIVLLLLSGACAGSVGGGIKLDRHIILLQKSVQEIRRFLHPNLVTRLKSNHQLLDDDMVLSVSTYFYIYIALIVLGTLVLSMCGIELSGALTAVMSCLGGIGPAIGQSGFTVCYSALPVVAKWVLGILMLIGRLEVYAVLVLVHPFHRKIRESERMLSLETMERDGMIEPFVRDYDEN